MKVWFVDPKRMKKAMKAKGLTVRGLAENTGLAQDTVAKLLYGCYPCEPLRKTKKAIAEQLELSIEVLFPEQGKRAS